MLPPPAATKPLNVLARPDLTMRELAAAGAQRISVGGALTWVAMSALAAAAGQIRDRGDFSALDKGGEVRRWLAG